MAVGNFKVDAADQAALNIKNQYVDSKGNFKAPFRKAGESYSVYQKRVKAAMVESGKFPRLTHAGTLTSRTNKKKYLKNEKEIEQLNTTLEKIEASKGTEREYSMSLGLKKIQDRLKILQSNQTNNPYRKELALKEQKNTSADLLTTIDQQQEAITNEAKAKVDGNNKPNTNKPLIPGQEVGRGTWVNGRWVDQGTSKSLMSSFRVDSSDQARNNLKVKQDSGETTYKSDVHTIDPDTGEPRGVVTRSQAKAFDAKHQEKLKEWANKPGNELRIYKNHQGAG